MSDETIDKEVEAIRNISESLQLLNDAARQRVIDYVLKRFNLKLLENTLQNNPQQLLQPEVYESQKPPVSHIKQLKELKKPKTAVEMAAIVAYYISELAPEQDRKNTVVTKDMETYFKIAEYPLPTVTTQLLLNAKTAGYFDQIGSGEYKLNAVGHNLVVHNLPRKDGESMNKTRRKKRFSSKSKVSRKSRK